ncbi:helix-turn-helix transcriptional regulator [Streptomyces sp. NPDC091385]|uniref:helix-turn-helix transcriptional regulator n=1 Tax=Streptomyces sp. NPDC091385 TaxID=3365997 RepID=UPI00382E9767
MNASRLHRSLRKLAGQGLGSSAYRHESADRIAAAVGADAYCFAETDPESLLATTYATGNLDRSGAALLHFNELGQRDFLKLRALAGSPDPAGALSAVTGGRLDRSARHRELLAPLGFGDEIRAVARTDGRVWGFLHLFRREDRPAFDPDEVGVVAAAAPLLAAGIRDAALGSPGLAHDVPGPVLALLDDTDRVVESTPGADEVLAALRDPDERRADTPDVAVMMAVLARAPAAASAPVTVRVRTRAGRWFSLHAGTTTADGGARRIALILEPVAAPLTPETWRARFGLSAGEAEVVEKMLAGRSTAQTAAELMISPWTVQDRFTSVFAKTGVHSRRELTGLLRP